ncbi:MAG: amidase [Methylobacteriaceae bacterium]|jgi:aspartyl-tRNA(Asn)/glutamyl-tRNA(Gln) amidotransferase subunit A|nr:amidase [Methylobacteriaceae bacterium]
MYSARETIEKTINRIVLRSSRSEVFTRVYDEMARVEAAAADSRSRAGYSLGPLDGVLVSVKDSFDIQGEATTAGSKTRRDAPLAREDAVVVKRLRRAGAVVVGKTNMSEFAFTGLGINPNFGTPENALDLMRVPGGSSAGAAVSVAEDTSVIAVGTDTGGSVRIPASFNGVVGFKPSVGRIPTDGVFPLSYSLDTVGPLARTVQSCADADAVMAGTEPAPLPDISLSGLSIAVPRGLLFTDSDAAVLEGFERCLSLLSAAGAKISDITVDDLLDAKTRSLGPHTIASMEACAFLQPYLERQKEAMDPIVHAGLSRGLAAPATAYILAMRRRAELVEEMQKRLLSVHLVALPTTPILAPLKKPLIDDPDLAVTTDDLILRNASVANYFNMTAISLPMPRMTFPSGFMLMARHNADPFLLAAARAVESLFFDNDG